MKFSIFKGNLIMNYSVGKTWVTRAAESNPHMRLLILKTTTLKFMIVKTSF